MNALTNKHNVFLYEKKIMRKTQLYIFREEREGARAPLKKRSHAKKEE